MTLRWTLRKRESLRESVWETETPAMWTWVPNHQKFSSDPEQIKQNLKGLHPISHAWSLKVTIKPGVCKNEYGNTKKVNFDLTILGHQDKMTVSICDYITLIQCNTNCLWYHMDFPCPSFFVQIILNFANVIATVTGQQCVDICIKKIILIKIQMSKVEVTAFCDCNCNGYQATNHSVCNSKDFEVKATMVIISIISNTCC